MELHLNGFMPVTPKKLAETLCYASTTELVIFLAAMWEMMGRLTVDDPNIKMDEAARIIVGTCQPAEHITEDEKRHAARFIQHLADHLSIAEREKNDPGEDTR